MQWIVRAAFVSCLSLTVAACGGSSGGSAGGHGGAARPTLPPDYSGLYAGLGLVPEGLPHGLFVSEAVKAAVAPGYLAFGTLMATVDLRMSLQAFEWAVPAMAENGVDVPGEVVEQAQAVSCVFPREDGTGETYGHGTGWLFYDLQAGGGREIGFGFGQGADACRPSGGALALYSGPDHRQIWRPDGQGYRFQLSGVGMEGYSGLQISSDGPFARYPHDLPGMQLAMAFTTQPDGASRPSSIAIDRDDGSALVTIRGGRHGLDQPSEIVTYKQASGDPGADPEMLFRVPHLDVSLETGELAGSYKLTTAGMTLLYKGPRGLAITAGGFEVTSPDGTIYSYRLPEGSDPLADTLYLEVTIVAPDMEDAVTGHMSQQLVLQRLRLAQS